MVTSKNSNRIVASALIAATLLTFTGCRKDQPPKAALEDAAGTIVFTANGEDFVRQGFVDKNGWHISFDKLYVNIVEPAAYGAPGTAVLQGSHWIDLAAGDENADPVVVGKIDDVQPGNYQSLLFNIRRAESGPYKGASIVMIGNAENADRVVPFEIRLTEEMDFDGKEGYVGDEIKGMLKPGDVTSVEMTFHFDHIFGDKEAPVDDHINTGSVGFDFFAVHAADGAVVVDQNQLIDEDAYSTLVHAIWTLGHLGEGHCHCTNQSSAPLFATGE